MLDDFALQPLDATETTDFYELIVDGTTKPPRCSPQTATPDEWLAMMANPLLAQSAVDRLVSTPRTRQRGRAPTDANDPSNHTKTDTTPACQLTNRTEATMLTDHTRWSLGHGKPLAPSTLAGDSDDSHPQCLDLEEVRQRRFPLSRPARQSTHGMRDISIL